jgi:hypothetical protein
MQKLRWRAGRPRYRGKPPGMSDRTFHKLNDQLTKEDIRYMCALLGKADPEFCDEEPPAPPKHPARQPRHQHLSLVRDQSVYFCERSGSLKMRAKFKKKIGSATSTHRKRPPF